MIRRVTDLPAYVAARDWIDGRSERERMLLAGLTLLALIAILWLIILQPLLSARTQALYEIRVYSAVTTQLAGAAPVSAQGPTLAPGPLEQTLPALAQQFSLTPDRVAVDDQVLNVAISNARYDSVTPFLAALESSGRVTLQSVTMTRLGSPGLVDVMFEVREP